jgi:hypothetical protein
MKRKTTPRAKKQARAKVKPSKFKVPKPRPLKFGSRWRFQTGGSSHISITSPGSSNAVFDEFVLEDFLHIEMMSDNVYWMRVGGNTIFHIVRKNGEVSVIREDYS